MKVNSELMAMRRRVSAYNWEKMKEANAFDIRKSAMGRTWLVEDDYDELKEKENYYAEQNQYEAEQDCLERARGGM